MKRAPSVRSPQKRLPRWVFPTPSLRRFCAKTKTRHSKRATRCWNRSKQRLTKQGSVASLTFPWFGNPYGDPWTEDEVCQAVKKLAGIGIRSISLADTVGVASADLIRRVVQSVKNQYADYDVGVHLHSRRSEAAAKVLAACDAGCRRFDSAIGGLGGCPFAQDALVGNIPTESVIAALQQRGVELPISKSLAEVLAVNSLIAANYS